MEHGARKHARYSASKASRFFVCPGSVRACEKAGPMPPTPQAIEGTKAHEVLEAQLAAIYLGGDPAKATAMWQDAPDDMKNAVTVAIDYVDGLMDADPFARLMLETRFEVPQDAVPREDCAGLTDIIVIQPSFRVMHVVDYKHGVGVVVEAKGNKQVRFYATGALDALPLVLHEVDVIQPTIIQPRAAHKAGAVRHDDVLRPEDLLIDFVADLEEAIRRCEAPDAPLRPTYEACQFCDARLTCPARQASALRPLGMSVAEEFGTVRLPDVGGLTPDQMGYILQAKEFTMAWFRDVETAAINTIRAGVQVPGRKLVESQARRRWHGKPADLAEQFIMIADDPNVNINDIMPRQLVTITDAERILVESFKAKAPRGQKQKAGEAAKQSMAFLTLKETSGTLSLVSVDDRRPPIDVAKRDFEGVTIELPYVDLDRSE